MFIFWLFTEQTVETRINEFEMGLIWMKGMYNLKLFLIIILIISELNEIIDFLNTFSSLTSYKIGSYLENYLNLFLCTNESTRTYLTLCLTDR